MGRVILARILEHKKKEVAASKARLPLEVLVERAWAAAPSRDFAAALRRNGGPVRVIAELKKASPSRGVLCPSFSVTELARSFARGGAAALSVLTDKAFFQGDLAFLAEAKEASRLPVLRKDFLIDPYQVYEAKAAGADAVLLIAAALPGRLLGELLGLSAELGLAALVEVHSAAELEQALEAGAKIIGFNNRDLQTFAVDLGVTERLAGLVPPGILKVSESGLKTAADVRRVAAAGVDAVLVGEALVTSKDKAAKVRELATALA